jgi:tetratricopeptide (TPR) repeat protein
MPTSHAKHAIAVVATVTGLALASMVSASTGGSRGAEERCESALKLVEDNSSDAVGGTREVLERGIADMESALKQGCPDPKAALLMLSTGYNTLAYRYSGENSPERKRFEALEKATNRKLGEVAGEDRWALMLYAQSLEDPANRVPVYEKITRLDPGDAEGHVGLAKALMLAGRKSEARRSFERALSVADTNALNRIAPDVDEFLRERGESKDADAMRDVAERRRAKVGTPSGR